jgi:hypothetical protein
MLNWRHPHFPADEAERWLQRAFRQEYEENSSSMLRVADTALRGYEALAAVKDRDACLDVRLAQMRERARQYALILPVVARTAVNGLERERVEALERRVRAAFGSPGPGQQALRLAARAAAAWWRLRVRHFGDGIQPRTLVTRCATRGRGPVVTPQPDRSTGRAERSPARTRPEQVSVGAGERR